LILDWCKFNVSQPELYLSNVTATSTMNTFVFTCCPLTICRIRVWEHSESDS